MFAAHGAISATLEADLEPVGSAQLLPQSRFHYSRSSQHLAWEHLQV